MGGSSGPADVISTGTTAIAMSSPNILAMAWLTRLRLLPFPIRLTWTTSAKQVWNLLYNGACSVVPDMLPSSSS